MRIPLCAALAFVMIDPGIASASSLDARPAAKPPTILAANGCGPGFFRTIDGACLPNDRALVGPRRRTVILPPPCPRGYLRDSNPARPLCYPVF